MHDLPKGQQPPEEPLDLSPLVTPGTLERWETALSTQVEQAPHSGRDIDPYVSIRTTVDPEYVEECLNGPNCPCEEGIHALYEADDLREYYDHYTKTSRTASWMPNAVKRATETYRRGRSIILREMGAHSREHHRGTYNCDACREKEMIVLNLWHMELKALEYDEDSGVIPEEHITYEPAPIGASAGNTPVLAHSIRRERRTRAQRNHHNLSPIRRRMTFNQLTNTLD